jgi:hypothetical protein
MRSECQSARLLGWRLGGAEYTAMVVVGVVSVRVVGCYFLSGLPNSIRAKSLIVNMSGCRGDARTISQNIFSLRFLVLP